MKPDWKIGPGSSKPRVTVWATDETKLTLQSNADKLRELAKRIEQTCSDDNRPTRIHWSDAQLLLLIAQAIETDQSKLYGIQQALHNALYFVKGDKA